MTTPIYAFPYPVLTDPPNGAAQIQALAEAVETTIDTLDTALSSTIATLANPPRAQLRTSTTQACANNTEVKIQFNLEDFDSASGHSTVTNNTRYTAQVAGTYLISGGYSFVLNATGNRLGSWFKNNASIDAGTNIAAGYGSNTGVFVMRTMMVALSVGDYIELVVSQSSGGALNTSPTGNFMSVLMVRNDSL